jgi:TPR repeat protein
MRFKSCALIAFAALVGASCPACGRNPERAAPNTSASSGQRSQDADAPNGVCPAGAQTVEHIGCVDERLAYSPDALDQCRSAGAADCDAACQRGDAPACTALGLVHLLALEASPNTAYAARFFDQACAQGDGAGCNDAGVLHLKAMGFPLDVERAETLFQLACEHGSVEGCVNLSTARPWGDRAPDNVSQAALAVQRACESASNARACAALGWMLERGSAFPRDERGGAQLYMRACFQGDEGACDNLGRVYLGGAGVKPDDARAFSLFREACNHARSDGCTDLAIMYCLGRGAPRDPVRSAALFRQACEAGDAAACRSKECSGWAPL